jgi:hypothetical protein
MRGMKWTSLLLAFGGSILWIGAGVSFAQSPFPGPVRPSTMNMGSPWSSLDRFIGGNAGVINMALTRARIEQAIAAQQNLLPPDRQKCFHVGADTRGGIVTAIQRAR